MEGARAGPVLSILPFRNGCYSPGMPGILWEGHRAQLYDERHCQISRVVNSTELKFDLVLELNTPDPSSVEMIVIFCDVILG